MTQVDINPVADRIAWSRTEQRTSGLTPLLRTFLSWWPVDTRHVEVVWTTDFDGGHARELGCIERPKGQEAGLPVSWLPDGQQLTFEWNGDHYIVDGQ